MTLRPHSGMVVRDQVLPGSSMSPAAIVHRESATVGFITLFTANSPILPPISVPVRVEER